MYLNIFDYIIEYGNYDFYEREFNEVDNAIFSCIPYLDLTGLVSEDFNNKITINELGIKYSKLHEKTISKDIMAVRNSYYILKKIMNTKRYKDILVYNYKYVYDLDCQFGAVSLDLYDNVSYISYEGTDDLVSGWYEDGMIAYNFPMPSQNLAVSYLNKFLFKNKRLIVGGHSKGGHLALIGSMYCNFFVKRKIIKIYSNDGLGLRKNQIESRKYSSIKNRVVKVVPEYSVVGHLLYSDDNNIIIKSTRKGLTSHNIGSWIVDDNKFERGINSKFCKVFEAALNKWSVKYNEEEKMKLIEELVDMCKENNIVSLKELKGKKSLILKLILDSRKIDPKTKEMFKELYKSIKECNKKYNEEGSFI